MIYFILADIVLVIHFCFVLFVIFGGFLVLFRRRVIWFHLPALLWGMSVEFFVLTCPLTTLEKHFRQLGGGEIYSGDFIAHLFNSILYPSLTVRILSVLGVVLVAFNIFVYLFVFFRLKRVSL